ncbi:MAG: tetratricopeptide repeat protein [Bacteroidota bacterium]
MNKKYYPFLLFLLFRFGASANIDSLKHLVYASQGFEHDSIELATRLEYAFQLYSLTADSLESIIEQTSQCILLASSLNRINDQVPALNLKAICLRRLGKFAAALNTFDETIRLTKEQGRPLRVAQLLDNKASVYFRMDQIDEALKLRLEALAIFKTEADSNAIARSYTNIGALYLGLKRYREAKNYFFLAQDNYSRKASGNTLANLIGNLAIAYKGLEQQDSALHYFLECRNISKPFQYIYNNNEAELGRFYAQNDQHEAAIESYRQLIQYYSSKSQSFSLHYYRILAVESLLVLKDYAAAQTIFTEINPELFAKRLQFLSRYHYASYQIQLQQGNYIPAIEEYKIFRNAKDSLNNIDRESRFKEIEEKYQLNEKEKVIAKQKLVLRQRLFWILILFVLLTLGTLFFLFQRRKTKYEKELREERNKSQAIEIDNLKKENKIISMHSMIEGQEEERVRIARDLHDNIGSLMTSIKIKALAMQNEDQSMEKKNIAQQLDGMITNAAQEVRRISHRMTPVALEIAGLEGAVLDLGQQLESNGIQMVVEIEDLDKIEHKKIAINLFRIIQEIVNNAIKHAQATRFEIKTTLSANVLDLQIGDDGIGFDKTKWTSNLGLGLSGIRSRVDYLNGTVVLKSSHGTHYHITIPLDHD